MLGFTVQLRLGWAFGGSNVNRPQRGSQRPFNFFFDKAKTIYLGPHRCANGSHPFSCGHYCTASTNPEAGDNDDDAGGDVPA